MRTVSKNEGSLGEKPNFGSKLGGIGKECYFWSFSERFKSRNLQNNRRKWQKWFVVWGGLWVRATEEPTFLQIMWGLWVTAKTISKYMVIGWQQSVLKIGGLWANRPTSALHPRHLHNGSAPPPGGLHEFVQVCQCHREAPPGIIFLAEIMK